MQSRPVKLAAWSAVAVVLVAFGVPWFLWGDAAVVAGLPLWVWWHVGWLGLAAVVFRLFATRAWGLGVEPAGPASGDPDRGTGSSDDPGRRSGSADRMDVSSGTDTTGGDTP